MHIKKPYSYRIRVFTTGISSKENGLSYYSPYKMNVQIYNVKKEGYKSRKMISAISILFYHLVIPLICQIAQKKAVKQPLVILNYRYR